MRRNGRSPILERPSSHSDSRRCAQNFVQAPASTYDPLAVSVRLPPRSRKPPPRSRVGPGLAKAQGGPRPSRREFSLWRSSDTWWRLLFERADVMSEGAIQGHGNSRIYFGTTSILLHAAAGSDLLDLTDLPELRSLATVDPHARVRAVRVACREAQVRAELPLERIQAHLRTVDDDRGLRLDIDVEAAVRAQRGPAKVSASTSAPAATARQRIRRPKRETR